MAVNLLRTRSRDDAEALLARSFAQYQADQRVAGEERRIAENHRALQGYAAENLHSEYGDFDEYWELRREQSRLESQGARDRRQMQSEAVTVGLARLRDGDVVAVPRGRGKIDVVAVVDAVGWRGKGKQPLLSVVDADGRLGRIGPREFDHPPQKVGWVRLPDAGNPRQDRYRKAVMRELRAVEAPAVLPRPKVRPPDEVTERLEEIRRQVRDHPVHRDPQLPEIEVWARRYDELRDDTERLER